MTKIEHKGKWRLPQSDEWFDGTLSFDPDIGARLEIFGTFNTFFLDRSSKEIILGKTTAGDITLIDNWYRNTKTIHNGITIGTYEPIFIIIGHHFEKTEDISFRKVIFRAFNLFQWLDKAGLNFSSDYSVGSYNVSFNRPDSINFDLNELSRGEISFESPTNSSDFYNKIELSEQAYIVLSYTEKTHYKTILKDIRVLIGFITFCTFEQSYALDITFKDENFTEEIQKFKSEKNIKCFFQNNSYDSKYKLRRKHEHLVKYKDIQEKFPELI